MSMMGGGLKSDWMQAIQPVVNINFNDNFTHVQYGGIGMITTSVVSLDFIDYSQHSMPYYKCLHFCKFVVTSYHQLSIVTIRKGFKTTQVPGYCILVPMVGYNYCWTYSKTSGFKETIIGVDTSIVRKQWNCRYLPFERYYILARRLKETV